MIPQTNASSDFINAIWPDYVKPFIDRECVYLDNGWTILGGVIATAGLAAGVALIIIFGAPAAAIGGMTTLSIAGIGVWIVKQGRNEFEDFLLATYLINFLGALENLNSDKTDPTKIQELTDRLTFIEGFKTKYPKVDNIRDDTHEWLKNANPEKTIFRAIQSTVKSMRDKVADTTKITKAHIDLADAQWDKFKHIPLPALPHSILNASESIKEIMN